MRQFAAAIISLVVLLAAVCHAEHQHVYEKTRFDRSIDTKLYADINKKQRVYTDAATQYTAYKDGAQSVCYLEQLRGNDLGNINFWRDVVQGWKKTLYASENTLTKIEAWRLAGGRIVDFCKGMTFILLQEERPNPDHIIDPFYNVLPEDENDIIQKRISDVVLKPLQVRVRRHDIMEEREKLNEEQSVIRRKREAHASRGRFRGQTQSQYMNVGLDGQKEGKAEAEATQQSSRAVVSGNSGMGQAQSMSSGNEGCDGCPGFDRVGAVPGGIIASGAKN